MKELTVAGFAATASIPMATAVESLRPKKYLIGLSSAVPTSADKRKMLSANSPMAPRLSLLDSTDSIVISIFKKSTGESVSDYAAAVLH
jgi:hypothetical protein